MKIESILVWLLTVSLMVYLTGCGSGSAAPAQPAVAQAPSISSLLPAKAVAGGPQFTLNGLRCELCFRRCGHVEWE
jgi:hypothetical protein